MKDTTRAVTSKAVRFRRKTVKLVFGTRVGISGRLDTGVTSEKGIMLGVGDSRFEGVTTEPTGCASELEL